MNGEIKYVCEWKIQYWNDINSPWINIQKKQDSIQVFIQFYNSHVRERGLKG